MRKFYKSPFIKRNHIPIGLFSMAKILIFVKRGVMKKSKMIHLPLVIEMDEDNICIVSCPIFKGCHSYGKTLEEAIENIKEVIEICKEEEKPSELNRFVGFRELEIPA
ncbi:MAG TPA: type II toxin-antitoxin system HicB family antitoxin [Salinimicrobium sp.]|nr:type II toxin-antitoxin system HicB family antitoxin [Salinimicrobium sp.]